MSISSISSQKDLWYILQQQRSKAQNSGKSTSNSDESTSATSNESTDIKSFLDKVKDGTVSESDLSSMQAALTKLQQQYGSSSSSLSKPDDEISSFLDKVQAGTVTSSDLSEMKTTLSQAANSMEKHFGPPPPGGPPPGGKPPQGQAGGSGGDLGQIDEILNKVQSGSVTDSDLTTLQTLLKNMTSDSEEESETDSNTVANSTASSALKSIQSFLDKVKDGTTTDSDFNSLQKILTELKTSSSSASNSDDSDSTSYSSRSSSTSYLMAALSAYAQHSGLVDLYNQQSSQQNYTV